VERLQQEIKAWGDHKKCMERKMNCSDTAVPEKLRDGIKTSKSTPFITIKSKKHLLSCRTAGDMTLKT
jgi:hypothetical protein